MKSIPTAHAGLWVGRIPSHVAADVAGDPVTIEVSNASRSAETARVAVASGAEVRQRHLAVARHVSGSLERNRSSISFPASGGEGIGEGEAIVVDSDVAQQEIAAQREQDPIAHSGHTGRGDDLRREPRGGATPDGHG